ncbi:MAG: 2-phosphosulfolactate phosphatase [Firmicutes bacterium]|nr:2-phosphosulfolactate phosphatase [Bacillota bacterium]
MEIAIVQGIDQAGAKAGVNVVIDVIRAFTVAQVAFARGARAIKLVPDVASAIALRSLMPDALLAGEVRGLPIDGFDLDNSPVVMSQADVSSRTLIQMTTNGVKGALQALQAQHVLVTGYASAVQTARYIQRILPELEDPLIRLIATHPSSDDDLACAEYIRGILLGTSQPTASETEERILTSEVAKKFFDPAQPAFDQRDIAWCARQSDDPFVMCVSMRQGIPTVERVEL